MDRTQPERPKLDPDLILAVWFAEDGRCEACKRPMDKRFARVIPIDAEAPPAAENMQLVCVDCKSRRPDPLRSCSLVLGEQVAARVLGHLPPEQLEAGTRWLAGQLKRYGVILSIASSRRAYWLPGVGVFWLSVPQEGPLVVTKVEHLAAHPQVRSKPQARTRGLPPPDRRPPQQPAKSSNPEKQPA